MTSAARLAGLSARERALLFEKLRERKLSAPGPAAQAAPVPAIGPPILPRDRAADPPPLSFAQQRLWFLDRLTPGGALYNIPAPLAVTGPLDVRRLRRALAGVVARHEALRTTFQLAGAEPVQVIAPPLGPGAALPPIVPVLDLSGLGEAVREAEAARLRREEAVRPFDLGAGPLLRAALVRLGAERHQLLLTVHHIVGDGWSNSVLVRELTALYDSCAPHAAALPELPVQYADFAVWQRAWLTGEVLARQVELWRRRLEGLPPALDLPGDRPRPALRSSRGAVVEMRLGEGLTARLKELARGAGATPFTVLLAVYQALLGRWTGQEDLAAGAPVANRNRPEVAGLIGFFVNTLVLRGDLSGDPGFDVLLGRLREVALEAFEHQDLPFEKLVEELRPQRDPSRPPLVQVMLVLQNTPEAALTAGGLSLAPLPVETSTSKLDLTLSFAEEEGGLKASLTYCNDLFDAATIRRLGEHFKVLAEAACAGPRRRLSELPLLTAGEEAQLLREWNDTADGREPLLFHERFLAQAARTPEAVAVESVSGQMERRSWTYRELAERAGHLAGRLAALGVGPEVIVGVQADRSPELVLGALAVWMADGAYLPLDPSHPRERRAWILEDAGAAVLLAAEESDLPPFAGPVVLGEPSGTAREASPTTAERSRAMHQLAYVLYTSGSTGRPKGVLMPHRGLANMAAAAVERFGAGPGSRVLLFASPAFDASLLDFALALGTGATLCLAPARELPGLGRLLRERAITHLHLPPSALAALVEGEPPPGLACVILGGEPCPQALAERWGEGRRLFNDYGPTEAAVFATADELRNGRLTTGRPVADAVAHVLDGRLRPVPAGVPGEVCLGGAGLARGYLGRPDLTAERFVPDPFGPPGSRLYRTGDLARRLPDGALDVLGRIDRQVKIRGVRVEPGEVEAALARHPGVKEAAAVVRGQGAERSLAAWAVPAEDGLETAALRGFLLATLPAPMVPSALVLIDRLPLTPNGKVDRAALARLEAAGGAAVPKTGEGAPPRNDLERAVAAVWCEILGREAVARDESFFDLGGHSLLLARMQARLAERLGREVPLLKLFEHPTVEALAAWLEGGDEGGPSAEAPSRERAGRQRQAFELQRRRLAGRGDREAAR